MALPFTHAEFLDVFERFNLAVGIAPAIAYAAAAVALVAVSACRSRATDLIAGGVLAGMWLFTGAVYFLGFFRSLTPAGVAFGVLFVAQGALLLVAAARGRLRFAPSRSPGAWLGAALVVYATYLYPLLGAALGHAHPRAPSFGVTPCPTVIFTFGMLLFTEGALPRWLLPIPLLWSAIGLSAALQLGMREDLALPVAGVLATAALVLRRPAGPSLTSAARTTPRRISA